MHDQKPSGTLRRPLLKFTFLILAFTAPPGFDYKTAGGNAKVVNLSSNPAAAVTLIAAGQIAYSLAVPAAACPIAGLVRLRAGLRRGARFISSAP